jgi:hypothetical protein
MKLLDPYDMRDAYMCSAECRDALKESNFALPVIIVAIHKDEDNGNIILLTSLKNKNTTKDW